MIMNYLFVSFEFKRKNKNLNCLNFPNFKSGWRQNPKHLKNPKFKKPQLSYISPKL